MIAIVVIVAFFLVRYLMSNSFENQPVKKQHLHKWIYKKDETGDDYLFCSECNKTPSQIQNSFGED